MADVKNNKKQFRYEIGLEDGEIAFMDYRWLKGNIVLMHTFVPTQWRGHKYADQLAEYVLDDVRRQSLKAVIYCPFVTKYLEQHPEYNDLIATK